MLSADDHSGVFSFMVGMVVLVMAGVGLSLVVGGFKLLANI